MTLFEIVFVDAKTRDVSIQAQYVGSFGFNGCHAALDLVFNDLSEKLRQKVYVADPDCAKKKSCK